MPSSHGVVQGYNAQALVDSKHQVILAAEAFASQDHENLKLNSLKVCKEEKVDAYIPDIQFRKRDPRFADQERFTKENATSKPKLFTAADFTFDATRQVYLCSHGKELTCHARGQVNRHRTYDLYHARTEDCAACPLKLRCLKKADTVCRNLSIQVDSQQPNLIDEMKAKIDSEQGKKIYARRLATLAPHAVQVLWSRFLRTSVCINTWTVSPYAPNGKWMYNGGYSLWFTISARSTPLGC